MSREPRAALTCPLSRMDQVNAVIIGKSEHPKLLAAESYDKETVDQLLQTEPMGEVVQVPNKERHSSFGSEGTKGRNRKERCSSRLSDPARPTVVRTVSTPPGSRPGRQNPDSNY